MCFAGSRELNLIDVIFILLNSAKQNVGEKNIWKIMLHSISEIFSLVTSKHNIYSSMASKPINIRWIRTGFRQYRIMYSTIL